MGLGLGSSVGHMVGDKLGSVFGGSSEPAQAPAMQTEGRSPAWEQVAQRAQEPVGRCAEANKQYMLCLQQTSSADSCAYYLDALKACQAAAAPY